MRSAYYTQIILLTLSDKPNSFTWFSIVDGSGQNELISARCIVTEAALITVTFSSCYSPIFNPFIHVSVVILLSEQGKFIYRFCPFFYNHTRFVDVVQAAGEYL